MKRNWKNEGDIPGLFPALSTDGVYLPTIEDLLRAAKDNGGTLKIVRYDRFFGKLVTDEITADMPTDEIIL